MTFAKALVPLFVSIALCAFDYVGVGPEMTVETAVTLLVTSGLVWLVPNKQ